MLTDIEESPTWRKKRSRLLLVEELLVLLLGLLESFLEKLGI